MTLEDLFKLLPESIAVASCLFLVWVGVRFVERLQQKEAKDRERAQKAYQESLTMVNQTFTAGIASASDQFRKGLAQIVASEEKSHQDLADKLSHIASTNERLIESNQRVETGITKLVAIAEQEKKPTG